MLIRMLRRLRSDERGIGVTEALMAGFVLAIGAFAVAQALTYGLHQTGLARQRQGAEALANQELEAARALNFTNVGLLDAGPLTDSTDPEDPDFWLNAAGTHYDSDGSGTAVAEEPLIFNQASPSLQHGPTAFVRSNTTYRMFDYATWVDDPAVSGTQNAKRVTVILLWRWSGRLNTFQISSLFTPGTIAFGPTPTGGVNQPPSVSCPTVSTSGLEANFTATATDLDGSVTRIDWDFGDGATVTDGGAQQSHTYPAPGTYIVVNTVFDDGGATASNAADGCLASVSGGGPSGGDTQPPSGSVSINNGAQYTRDTQVTLNLSATDDVAVTEVSFSDDGTNFGSSVAYSTAAIYTVPSGDGQKTVYVRFRDAAGNQSSVVSDAILLDTVVPPAPSGLTVNRASNRKSAVLQWNSVVVGDLAGYALYRRPTTTPSYRQIPCQFIYGLPNKCLDDPEDNRAVYEFYVVAIDLAGNVSAESNHVTV